MGKGLKTVIGIAVVGAAAYGVYWYIKNKTNLIGKTSSATGVDYNVMECPKGYTPNKDHTKCVPSSISRLRTPVSPAKNVGYSNYTY